MLLVVVLRLPNLFEPYWYGDEGIYLAVGQAMRHGAALYEEIIDHKTPLIYYWAAVAYSLVWLKVMLLFLSLTGLWFFHNLCQRFMPTAKLVFTTTLVYALLTTVPALEGNIANGELFLMPFILAGVWWLWRRWPTTLQVRDWQKFHREVRVRQPVLAGILFSLALLTKVPAGFDFAAIGAFWLFVLPIHRAGSLTKQWFKYGVFLIIGFLIPIGLSIVWFALTGHLGSYLQFGLFYNFRYIEAWGTPFTNPLVIFLTSMKGRLLVLFFGLGILWYLRNKMRLPVLFTFIWFEFTLFAALLSLRPYPHYFIQIVPPLSLLIGFIFSEAKLVKGLIGTSFLLIWLIFKVLGFHTYPTVAYYTRFIRYVTKQITEESYLASFDAKAPQTYLVAEWLRKHTSRNEKIFIWGNEPMVYALSRRSPAGRFTVAFHIQSFEAWDETMQSLADTQPRYIIDYLHAPDQFPALYNYLKENYLPIERLQNAEIYRRIGGLSQ